jgi:DNA-binding GntR family transcriptional regulator
VTIEKKPGAAVQRKNLTEQLYEILEDQIISGDIQPGTKLSEENVAEVFGVSRSPAREAITELERIGLAARVGPRDRIVAMPTAELIQETFEIWWILDSGRSYLSSLKATEEDHERLYRLLDEIDEAQAAGDENRRVKLSEAFHGLLYNGCTNGQLLRIINDYGKYIRWFKTLYYRHIDKSETSRLEHRQIVDNYVQKDLLGLTDLIRRHILRQRDDVITHFGQSQGAEDLADVEQRPQEG